MAHCILGFVVPKEYLAQVPVAVGMDPPPPSVPCGTGGPNPEVLRRVPGCQRVLSRVDGNRRDGGVRPSAMPLRCGRDPDGPATGRQRPAGWWQRVQTLRVLGEMARGRKTLESEKLVWGWKTRFWKTHALDLNPSSAPLPAVCPPQSCHL